MYFSTILQIHLCLKKKGATGKGDGMGEEEIREKREGEVNILSVKIKYQINANLRFKAGPFKVKYKCRAAAGYEPLIYPLLWIPLKKGSINTYTTVKTKNIYVRETMN